MCQPGAISCIGLGDKMHSFFENLDCISHYGSKKLPMARRCLPLFLVGHCALAWRASNSNLVVKHWLAG